MTPSHSDPGRRVLREKIHEVFRHLPKALTGDADSVHEMRVAGRRLRVALPLLALRPAGRRVRRALAGVKDLTRAAGVSRDLDVMFECLQEELPPAGTRSGPQSLIVGRLRNARRRARARMTDMVLDLDIGRLRRDLRAIVTRGSDSVLAVLQRLRQTEAAEAAELLGMLHVLGEEFEPVALHRMRIRLRRLRYTAELEAEVAGRPLVGEDLFKGLQDDLGRIRDLVLVSHWLGERAAGMTTAAPESAEAHRLEQRFLDLSRAQHRSFIATHPRARIDEVMKRLGHRSPAA